MECVIHTRTRSLGLDEELTGFSDYHYFSFLPNFKDCIGVISRQSNTMLEKHRKQEVEQNLIQVLSLKRSKGLFSQSEEFLVYRCQNMRPVLYDVPGYNCMVSLKGNDYGNLASLKEFYRKDHGFQRTDFDNLELHTNYIICSYYECEATHFYTTDFMANQIIAKFNQVCFQNSQSKLSVVELETGGFE